MKEKERLEMLLFLVQNVDVFAWSPYEVLEVDPKFIVHKLNVDPLFPSKKQKPRRSAKEHVEVVRLEVRRLKEAGVIREIFFPEWLANTVVVKKKNGKWRVCVDFTNLNRVCPKDLFPMPKIDQLVDVWAPEDEYFGCLSRLSPDCFDYRGSRKDSIYLP